jgi:L-aspartate oxidase
LKTYDVLLLGSGLAGMSAALHLADRQKVALVTKHELLDGASSWAQGGIAAVLDGSDSIEDHIRDTHVAGAGLCHDDAVRFVVERGKRSVEWLVAQGVPFTREDDNQEELHLTREGGHSHRRIAHAADATGSAVQNTLVQRVKNHPNIHVLEWHIGVDLITTRKHLGDVVAPNRVWGAYVLDIKGGGVHAIGAKHTLLATGGAGKVYLYTTNPDTSTGDGVAMGWRAGAPVANMEFIQFHPTCLFHPHAKSFLISEALRGEGGILRLPDGERFMPRHDARAELAPRDIVARAIDFEIKKLGIDCVFLDITHKGADFIKTHFPTIYAKCLEFGIDITVEPIPVVPAAHYSCGGVVVDADGRSSVPGLWAIGETTCSGLHGANRLASNSLLEGLVYGRRAALAARREQPRSDPTDAPEWNASEAVPSDEAVVVAHNWDELRRFMWDYVGIVRTNNRLDRAAHRIQLLQEEIGEFYGAFHVTRDLLELRNLVTVADLIVRSAKSRHESRGLHFSRDYPQTAAVAVPTTLVPG